MTTPRKFDIESAINQGLGEVEFHNRELLPEERGELRAMLALYRYEIEKKRRRKDRWQSFTLILGLPTALAALVVIADRLWAVLTKGH